MAQRTIDRTPIDDKPPRMTYEEFLQWVPDGKQAEWVDGEVILLTVNERHDAFTLLLIGLLSTYVRVFDLGRVLHAPFQMRLRFRPSGREPDVMFLRRDHLDRIARLWIEGAADFVIELLSEQTARTDLIVKLREYEQAGIFEYVIIETRDGRDGITMYRLGDDGHYFAVAPDDAGRLHSEMLPGFWLDPRWFQQDPLPVPEELMFELAPDAYDAWLEQRRGNRAR
ncbi:MAG TPA: Uma2 family endonuclease [Thermomicrobiales bacterium]|nr:Uma2 family endonuclease [Thermomicrobiales bacterium]